MRPRFKGVFGVDRSFQRIKHTGWYFWTSLYETVHDDGTQWTRPRTTYLHVEVFGLRIYVWRVVEHWSLLEY